MGSSRNFSIHTVHGVCLSLGDRMNKFALGAVLLVASSQAVAWGPREQGALAGFVGGVIVGGAVPQQPYYGRIPPPPPVYREQPNPPVIIQGNPNVIIIQRSQPVAPAYTPIPGGYMDLCHYRNQQANIYDRIGNVIGWRYCQ